MKNFFIFYASSFNKNKVGLTISLFASWLLLPLIAVQFILCILVLDLYNACKWFAIFLAVALTGDLVRVYSMFRDLNDKVMQASASPEVKENPSPSKKANTSSKPSSKSNAKSNKGLDSVESML